MSSRHAPPARSSLLSFVALVALGLTAPAMVLGCGRAIRTEPSSDPRATPAPASSTLVGARSTIGSACSPGSFACSTDGKAILQCRGGGLERLHSCLGPNGCYVGRDDLVRCDQSLASEGDDCKAGLACSLDGKARLVCADGVFVANAACKGRSGCVVREGRPACEGKSQDVVLLELPLSGEAEVEQARALESRIRGALAKARAGAPLPMDVKPFSLPGASAERTALIIIESRDADRAYAALMGPLRESAFTRTFVATRNYADPSASPVTTTGLSD